MAVKGGGRDDAEGRWAGAEGDAWHTDGCQGGAPDGGTDEDTAGAAEGRAAPRSIGDGVTPQERRRRRRVRPPVVMGDVPEGLRPKEMQFLAYYLATGRRSIAVAAERAGISARTGQRYLLPGHPVREFLDRSAKRVIRRVSEAEAELEALVVDGLLAGLRSQEAVPRSKALELAIRVLGLDRGGSEHEIGPETRAVLDRMAMAIAEAAPRGKAGGLGGDGL